MQKIPQAVAYVLLVSALGASGAAQDAKPTGGRPAASEGTAAKKAILHNIAREELPEFSNVHLIRGAADITASMPRYVAAYIREVVGGEG